MSEAYSNMTLKIADLYYLKDGVSVKADDLMVLTGNTVNGRLEVDKMGASYTTDKVVGPTLNALDSTYTDRAITIAVKGPVTIKAAKAVVGNQQVMGSAGTYTETFVGDETAQQEVYVGNVPISTVTSFTEDPTGTPQVFTRVATTATPIDNQYSLDDDTGKLIIGGTSLAKDYVLIYSIVDGRIEPHIDMVEETLAVTTNVATLTHLPKFIEYVESLVGATLGHTIVTDKTPATGEVAVDIAAGTLTFAAGDSVSSCIVRYKTAYKSCGIALQTKAAGEMCKIYFEGVRA